jgi:hypothetical protein
MAGLALGSHGKILAALRAIVREYLAEAGVQFHYPVRYRVTKVAPADKRLHLQIVNKKSGFPDALPISLWPGSPGATGEPALGSLVLVQFIEGDPTMPIVTHFNSPQNSTYFVPVKASLDASTLLQLGASSDAVEVGKTALLAAARQTDAVQAGPFAGTITGGSLTVKVG